VIGGAQDLAALWRLDRAFEPKMSADEAQARMRAWETTVRAVVAQAGAGSL
jgi:glycerol kinase